MNPQEALNELMSGNRRFAEGYRSVRSLASTLRFQELAQFGQNPFAVVLTCADARVPAEIVFDQGLGDLYVIRVAGNVVLPSIVASVEFACVKFGVPLCIVMGHTQCGAIDAAMESSRGNITLTSESFTSLIQEIEPALKPFEQQILTSRTEELYYDITKANVHHSIVRLKESSPIIQKKIETNQFAIIGGIYDLHSGRVNTF